MVVLGLDPGMTRLGFGAIETHGDKTTFLFHGMICHPREADIPYNQHLDEGIRLFTTDFPRVLGMVEPDIICSETVPVGRLGSNTELVVAAITVCKVIAYQWDIPWYNLGANTIKQSVTGDGLANKTKVRNVVLAEFPTVADRHKKLKQDQKSQGEKRPQGLPQDVFDALAVAMTGAKVHGKVSGREASGPEGSVPALSGL